VWCARETEYYRFHLEPPLQENTDLGAVVAGADARYLGVLAVLGRGPVSPREREGLLKVPSWLFAPAAIADADLPTGSTRFATGAGVPAGAVFAQRGSRRTALVDLLTHETAHVVWGLRAGQAPSLLDEAIAVSAEARLSARSRAKLRQPGTAWERSIGAGARPLREWCRNDGFWRDQPRDRGLPPAAAYRIGGTLAGYLLGAHGAAVLEARFRHPHSRDEHLAATLEETLGLPRRRAAGAVGAWWRGRATGA